MSLERSPRKRKITPSDISLPPGFQIDVFEEGLTTPINLILTDRGEMLLADAGVATGNGRVLRRSGGRFEVMAEGFTPPLTGITYHKGDIYVAHRGSVTQLKTDGSKTDILTGLPSFGDHHNNRVVFGRDGKMYFGQGTATNTGVVGKDNDWIKKHPCVADVPGEDVLLKGQNFVTENLLAYGKEKAKTGAFAPFGSPAYPDEIVKGNVRASGSILRANPDGTGLELVAWGLRNPFRMRFDKNNQLFSTNHGMDVRGSRPVANSPDDLWIIWPDVWYGWPDYTGGRPVTDRRFKPEGKPQPEFLLKTHPNIPPKPFAAFAPHSAPMGFDFIPNETFGTPGDIMVAEFGAADPHGKESPRNVGHRVSRIDMRKHAIHPFAINKSGFPASYTDGGGLERPIDILFGTNRELFIVDFAMEGKEYEYTAETGVIWRVTRK